MKIAIWSDLHIGKRQYRTDENNINKFEQTGYKALRENVDAILAEKPDLIINAGDVFDVANPSVLALNKYFNAQKRFGDIPTMTILGNHDFNFNNRKHNCSAAEIVPHTYFADYSIKTVELEGILFVMMPYIYDTDENIAAYLKQCEDIAKNSDYEKKILVAHGVTEKYYKNSFVSDKLMLSDYLVSLFNFVIIGHIHTSFAYKQGSTIVLSPGGMIDYQSNKDKTGPVILDTDNWDFRRVPIKTPHLIKVNCTEANINEVLANVTEDIYQITFKGSADVIDNDLFIKAKEKTINLTFDVVQDETVEDIRNKETKPLMNIYEWVKTNYPDYDSIFQKVREELSKNE